MIISEKTHISLTQLILEFLVARKGEMPTLRGIASAIRQPISATKEELTRLVVLNRVRKAGPKSSVSYYVPSETQLERENVGLVSNFKPLRPRTEHASLIARIRAERDAIQSKL